MVAARRQRRPLHNLPVSEPKVSASAPEETRIVGAARPVRPSDRHQTFLYAAHGSAEEACAVAKREDLDERLVEILSNRPEHEVLYALACNRAARLPRPILRRLMERGREDFRLARALLRRDFLHLCHFRLFLQANDEERGHLIAVAGHSRLHKLRATNVPAPDAGKLARLEQAAAHGDRPAFARALAHALGCEPIIAQNIAQDRGGEALALAFVAMGLSIEATARIFLEGFADISLTGEKFRPLMRIVESMRRRTAARLIRTIIDEPVEAAA